MPATDAGLVFLPRFTTLVGEGEFATAPLDVSGQAGTQFQVWRGPLETTGGSPQFFLYLEESLDAQSWALGPSTPQALSIPEDAVRFFSYSFRLRWFRLRVAVQGTNAMVSCWAEGILRGGDGGMWGEVPVNPLAPAGVMVASTRPAENPWAGYIAVRQRGPMPWENPITFMRQLDDMSRRIQVDWASTHGGAPPPPPPPNLPGWFPPWIRNAGVPVSPPQLQIQGGP